MASHPETTLRKPSKTTVLGRSAATGRLVLVPAVGKKSIISDSRIEAAVKNALHQKH